MQMINLMSVETYAYFRTNKISSGIVSVENIHW